MTTPTAVTATQAAFYAIGVLLLMLGVRAGTVRSGAARWMRRENMHFPLVWAGVLIFGLGALFSVVAGIIWFSWFRLTASILTVGLTAYIVWMVHRLRTNVKTSAINDHADELDDDRKGTGR